MAVPMAKRTDYTPSHHSSLSDEDWHLLQASVVLVCRPNADGESADENWKRIDCALREWASAAKLAGHSAEFALTVLASLADDITRLAVIAYVRRLTETVSEYDLRALTARAGEVVERMRQEQGFSFRALLTLISLEISDGAGGNSTRQSRSSKLRS